MFEQTPNSHLNGSGCPKCSFKYVDEGKFINKAKKIHGDKYDYSKIEYVNAKHKIKIVCPIHGEFEQIPNTHLKGSGCKKCYFEKQSKAQRLTTDEFIEKANMVHKNKYNYDNVFYSKNNVKVKIVCPIHGEFEQTPQHHLKGSGCKKCGDLSTGLHAVNNSRGWSMSKWLEKIKNNENLKPILYLIKCLNDEELFFKIGITTRPINKRFCNKTLMPYNFEELLKIEGDGETIFNNEIKIKKILKKYRYTPNLKFKGMGECFKINETELVNLIKEYFNEQYYNNNKS